MNLAALTTELAARGYDYITPARLTAFINDAITEINEAEDWPYLEATTSGTAPLTIGDVREVLSVIDTTNDRALSPIDIRTLAEIDSTVSTSFTPTTTGTASNWWLDGLTTVRVWPADTTSTFAVKYIKNETALSSGNDSPLLPARYHSLIVDVAQAMAAYRDESDQTDQQAVRAEVDRAAQRIATVLLSRELDGPTYIVPVVSENC